MAPGMIRPSFSRKEGAKEVGGSQESRPLAQGSTQRKQVLSTSLFPQMCQERNVGKGGMRVDSWVKILRKEVSGRERQKKGKQRRTLL